MIKEDTILSPSSLFSISLVVICFVTGLMHPQEIHLLGYGVIYMLSAPSAYLLLIIYSITNMNNMSWGTRESAPSADGAQRTAPTGSYHSNYLLTYLLTALYAGWHLRQQQRISTPCC